MQIATDLSGCSQSYCLPDIVKIKQTFSCHMWRFMDTPSTSCNCWDLWIFCDLTYIQMNILWSDLYSPTVKCCWIPLDDRQRLKPAQSIYWVMHVWQCRHVINSIHISTIVSVINLKKDKEIFGWWHNQHILDIHMTWWIFSKNKKGKKLEPLHRWHFDNLVLNFYNLLNCDRIFLL